MSPNKYFILKVISAQITGLWKARLSGYRRIAYTIKRKESDPSSIVEISFGDVIQRTGVAENTTSPIWNESFLISCPEQSSGLVIVIKIKVDDTCIGEAEVDLDELVDENEEEVPLFPFGKPKSKRNGSIVLQLEAADLRVAARCAVKNLSQAIQQKSSDSSSLSQLIGDVAPDIRNILELVDDIARLNTYLKLSLGLLTLVGKRISQQLKFNKELEDMKDSLEKALDLTNTMGGTNPTKHLGLTQDQLLEFIIYCAVFIQDYIRHSLNGQAYRGDKRDKKEEFKEKLGKLRKEIGEALPTQIGGEVGRVDGRLDDVLERMPKKEILKELENKLSPMLLNESEVNRSNCMEGTRIQVLGTINSWFRDKSLPNIFLLTGGVGTGKSTIARTIAQQHKRKGELGAYIFFTRDGTYPNVKFTTITDMVIQTIAYNLSCYNSKIAELVYAQIGDFKEILFPSSETLFEKFLSGPLRSYMTAVNNEKTPMLVVLDALDECGDSNAQRDLSDFIVSKLSGLPSNFRFLITSRPEKGVNSLSQSTSSHLCEHMCLDPKSDDCKRDILKFIKHEMGRLREREDILVDVDWPWDESMEKLGDAADGLFIWASTAIKYIEERDVNQFEYLKGLVKNSRTLSKNLYGLYAAALENSVIWGDPVTKERFCSVFSLILFGKTLLTGKEIDDILGLRAGSTRVLLSRFRSLVTYNEDSPIRINHISLYDYLIECKEEEWYIDESIERNRIALCCFGLMKSQLRFNICDLETSFKFNADVPNLRERVDKRIRPGLLYACRHWASHLRDVPYPNELLPELDNFAYKQLLYWLEVLSLTGTLYKCFEPVLESAIGWVKELAQIPNLILEQNKETHTPSELLSFLEDALHHVFEFIQPISESTPHLYTTFLPLKKSESNVARHYSRNMKEPTRFEYIGDKATVGCIRQIDVGSSVSSISFSYYGDQILSGSPSGVCLWDVDSGKLIRGPFGGEASVPCCFNNRILVVNRDGNVDEWSADTCERIHGLPTVDIGHVTSVSSDGRVYYATGFEDGAIRLWDRERKTAIEEPMKGHSRKVLTLSFGGLMGDYLASGSEDQNIIIWDVERREKKYAPLRGHSGPITSLAFRFFAQTLVSGSLDGTVRLWDVSTGETLHVFSASGMGGVYSVACIDLEYRYILSGSEDGIIRMWDTKHREVPPKKYVGHMGKVISLAVADDPRGIRFASGSSDGKIRVWDVEREREIVGGHVNAIAVSPNGEYLVSASENGTVSVWRIGTGELVLGPLEGHSKRATSLSFSPDGLRFASGSEDGTVRIWNLAGYALTCSTEGQQAVRAVCFSPDGNHVASGTNKSIQIWDSQSGELALNSFEGHSGSITSTSYSPDGKRIVSGSDAKTICIWDASNGTLLLTLQGHSTGISSVKYSHDGSHILSASGDGTVRFWDDNGKPARESIKVHEGSVVRVYFSPDDTYVISVSRDEAAHVWDISTGNLLFELNPSSSIMSLVLLPSSDSKYIKFASVTDRDGLIRIYYVDIDSKGMISDAPNKDGWLVGNDGNLLSWIPSDICRTLIYGSCVRILNSQLSTKLTLSKYQGSQWTSCFPSSNTV